MVHHDLPTTVTVMDDIPTYSADYDAAINPYRIILDKNNKDLPVVGFSDETSIPIKHQTIHNLNQLDLIG